MVELTEEQLDIYTNLLAEGYSPFEAREIARAFSHRPSNCPKCGGPLESSRGYVGEELLYCREHGIQWEDAMDAVRRVI